MNESADDFDREQFRKGQIVFDIWQDMPIGDAASVLEYENNVDAAIREHINFASIIAFSLIFQREGGSSVTANARLGALAKLANDPKQRDKTIVRSCWDDWQKEPSRYKGKAAFARDMRDKFPNLESQPVIEGWCRAWERET